MRQNQYSEEFKRSAVQKVLLRGNRTIDQICGDLGITTPSFYEWRKKCANAPGMKKSERRPQDWSPAEKLKAVIEFEKLEPGKQGEFLRTEGLHSDHIETWKKSMQTGLESNGETKVSRAEMAQLKAQNKALERDLNKKDKALAEVTALLVLKKKADLIWGTGENE